MKIRPRCERRAFIVCEDRDGFLPMLEKQALKETPAGEKPNVSVIVRRAVRAELARLGILKRSV